MFVNVGVAGLVPRRASRLAMTAIVAVVTAWVAAWFALPAFATEPMLEPMIIQSAPLEGQTFRASIVRSSEADQAKSLGDTLTFSNGLFGSALCRRYNFPDVPYWIRRDRDQVHFLAEMTSPTDGKMVWQGTIKGGNLEGTMRWTKRRWYWTIDVEHRIRGTFDGSSQRKTPATN